MGRALLLIAALSLMTGDLAAVSDGAGADAFAKLHSLVGEWAGPVEWTGARRGAGEMSVSYTLTGYGSAIVENSMAKGDDTPAMTSVYHMDGADLRMTHFCGARNQPRLRAERIDLAHGVIDFAFVDVTNLQSPDAGHVHGVEIKLLDANHFTLTFVFQAGGRESRELITLTRVHQKTARADRH